MMAGELNAPARQRLREMLGASLEATARPLRQHYAGLVSCAIRALLRGIKPPEAFGCATVDQPQQNGAYGVHQFRLRLPGDQTIYRVIVAPADAPVSIGGVSADSHFLDPITTEG